MSDLRVAAELAEAGHRARSKESNPEEAVTRSGAIGAGSERPPGIEQRIGQVGNEVDENDEHGVVSVIPCTTL